MSKVKRLSKENKKVLWKKIRKGKLGTVPREISSNLYTPELAPTKKKWTWNKEKTDRLHPLATKVREDFYWRLKELALKEKCKIVELIERAVEDYAKKVEEREKKKE